MKPQRIQRKRTKGWKMPENTVYVGRPSKWGNPYRAGDWFSSDDFMAQKRISAHDAFMLFKVNANYYLRNLDVSELKGKNLACWCPLVDKNGNKVPCHADILLEIANS